MQRIFAYLTEQEEQALLERGGVSRFSPGAVIVRQGDHHNAIYVVRVGEVRVEKGSAGFPLEVARLGPGQLFGEMSFIDGSPANADYVADDYAETYVLDEQILDPLLKKYPSIYGRLFRSLAAIIARRLRDTASVVDLLDAPLPRWHPDES
jgi:CRP-like cAMP-binding protein